MREAMFDGVHFAADNFTPDPPSNLDRRIREAFLPHRLDANGSLEEALVEFAFYFGMSEAILRTDGLPFETVMEGFTLGAHAQQLMTEAFLWMTDEDRMRIFDDADREMRVDTTVWRANLTGPMAVALIARELIANGWVVYLPSDREDAFGRIDLIAAKADGSGGLCLQVKASAKHADVVFRKTEADDPQLAAQSFLRGTSRFRSEYGGFWQAFSVHIGFDGNRRGTFAGQRLNVRRLQHDLSQHLQFPAAANS
jgi:hypothetical protein